MARLPEFPYAIAPPPDTQRGNELSPALVGSGLIDVPWWQYELGARGSILADERDIEQSIRIILTTPKGTDPHRPNFATEHLHYLDWPIDRASPLIVREALKAILTWEPRITVDSITVVPHIPASQPTHSGRGSEGAQMDLNVAWRLKDGQDVIQSTIPLTNF